VGYFQIIIKQYNIDQVIFLVAENHAVQRITSTLARTVVGYWVVVDFTQESLWWLPTKSKGRQAQ